MTPIANLVRRWSFERPAATGRDPRVAEDPFSARRSGEVISLGRLELRVESIREILGRLPRTAVVASLERRAAQASFGIEHCRRLDFGLELRATLEAKIEDIEDDLALVHGEVPSLISFFR